MVYFYRIVLFLMKDKRVLMRLRVGKIYGK